MTDTELDLYFKQRLELELKDPAFLTARLLESEKKVLELKIQNAIMIPKAELHDSIIRCSEQTSITEIAKVFKMHPRLEVIPYLDAQGYILRKNSTIRASMKAISEGILENKEFEKGGQMRMQAVITPSMFPKWQNNIIPNVKRWVENERIK